MAYNFELEDVPQEIIDEMARWDNRTGRTGRIPKIPPRGPISAAHRANISNALRMGPESERLTEKRERGAPLTKEHRAKISRGVRLYHARKQK